MMEYILPGTLGLLLGLILRWSHLSRPEGLRSALALRRSHALRSLLQAIGAGMALTALMMWLAVIDVDEVVPLPLSAGTLAGGVIFGVAAALAGFTPMTAFAGAGGSHGARALCTLAGCLAGTLLLPLLEGPLAALRGLPPHAAATLFRVTLNETYLLGGGFLGQACTGLLLMTIAVCIPSNRRAAASVAPDTPADVPEMPAPDAVPPDAAVPAALPPALPEPPPLLRLPAPAQKEAPSAEPAPPVPDETTPPDDPGSPANPPPEEAAGETFIALLPGEEPLVVDTGMEEDGESPA